MKIFTILLCLVIPLYSVAQSQKESNDFILRFIQHTLNATSDEGNFAVAPYEMYEFYKDLFESNAVESFQPTNEDSIVKQQAINESLAVQNISLKARWTFTFQTRYSSKRHFRQLGSECDRILMDYLRKDDVFRYARMEDFNASILELPLHFDKIKLLIILPDEPDGLDELKEYLNDNTEVIEEISQLTLTSTLVRVLLPRFHLDYVCNLREFYEELVEDEIDKYADIQQITNLQFGDRGIGVFRRATVLFWNAYSYLRIAPVIVDISHPFLFMIKNKDGIQFFGQVVNFEQKSCHDTYKYPGKR